MVFSTACDSTLITSTVQKWRPSSFILNWGNIEELQGAKSDKQGGWQKIVMLFLVKNSLVKKEV
jgi:hypothetical protein